MVATTNIKAQRGDNLKVAQGPMAGTYTVTRWQEPYGPSTLYVFQIGKSFHVRVYVDHLTRVYSGLNFNEPFEATVMSKSDITGEFKDKGKQAQVKYLGKFTGKVHHGTLLAPGPKRTDIQVIQVTADPHGLANRVFTGDIKFPSGHGYDKPADGSFVEVTTPPVSERPVSKLGTHKFTKYDLVAYVLGINGPMDKLTILKKVADLEGKVFVPTSNGSYFAVNNRYGAPSLLQRDIIAKVGRVGNVIQYTCTAKGMVMCAQVREKLGEDLARV